MLSLPKYKVSVLVIILVSSILQPSGAQTAENNCDLSTRSHIHDFCAVYYDNLDLQTPSVTTESSSTTESSPSTEASRPAVDCKVPFVYIVPLFQSNTSELVGKVWKMVNEQIGLGAGELNQMFNALMTLCSFMQDNFVSDNGCNFEKPDYNIATNTFIADFKTNCQTLYTKELASQIKALMYKPDCMAAKFQQANETCSAFIRDGCFSENGSQCVVNLLGNRLN